MRGGGVTKKKIRTPDKYKRPVIRSVTISLVIEEGQSSCTKHIEPACRLILWHLNTLFHLYKLYTVRKSRNFMLE
jgi:hypothetical protein